MLNNLIETQIDKEKKTGTKEWADYNVNCINGCYNNCKYCYAKMIAKDLSVLLKAHGKI